jgi:Cd2+/Zn2+-exporting ATPase
MSGSDTVNEDEAPVLHEFCIRGLHCSDCVKTVKNGLVRRDGVASVDVSLGSGKVCVTYDPAIIEPETIEGLVQKMGYSVERGTSEEEEEVLRSDEFIATVAAGALLLFGLLMEFGTSHYLLFSFVGVDVTAHHLVYLASMVFGGAYILQSAVRAMMSFTFTAAGLMIIAAVGATAIGEMAEGAAVLFLYSLAELLEDWSAERNRRSMRSLVDLAPRRVRLLRGDTEVEVQVEEVKPGDLAIVRPGDYVPVDGVVVEGTTSVNEATITGEAAPVPKAVGSPVYAGTMNVDGAIDVKVTAHAHDTTLNKIISMVEEAEERRAPVERFIDRFARYYTPVVLLAAVLVATVPPLLLGADGEAWFYRALMLLVIACPCALAISVPVAVVSAVSAAAKQGILIKGGAYLEQMSDVDVVAFDKTGTLTSGDPRLVDIRPIEGWTRDEVLALAAGVEEGSEHHLAQAVLTSAKEGKVKPLAIEGFKALPGKGVTARLSEGGHEVMLGNPGWAREQGIDLDEGELSRLAARGHTVVIVGHDGKVVGMLAFSDTLRPFARESVAALEGLRTMLLSGDSKAAAKAIGAEVGVTEVFAPLLPEEKVDMVSMLRAQGHKVAMVGDGVNDAPSLAEADVGIAMGAVGSDVAMDTADVVLLRDDISLVPMARQLSERAMGVIRQNITLAITIKLSIAVLVFMGLATLWMAVAIGDMGASLVVILNALRLGMGSKEGGSHASPARRSPPAVVEPA